MITYFQFLLLSLNEKKQYLAEKGTFLLSRFAGNKEVYLYAVNDFFVEVYLDENREVTETLSFKGTTRLEEHISGIDLLQINTLNSTGKKVLKEDRSAE